MNFRTTLQAAGISGALGVILGAFGAHKLKPMLLQHGMMDVWETAVRYHMLHAVALFCLAVFVRQPGTSGLQSLRWTARSWVIGTLLFSGSLYALALGGPRWLGPVTPIGGVALMAGWILLVVAATRIEK